MAVIVHDNSFINFNGVFFLILCPKENEIFFDMGWFKEELAIMTSKKDVRERLVWDDMASCNHNR